MAYEVWPGALAVKRQAGRIGDPVERLRFLRKVLRDCPASLESRPALPPRPSGRLAQPWLAALLLLASATNTADALRPQSLPGLPLPAAPDVPEVWLVERTPDWERYSNGLRVEHRLAVSTRPRLYRLLPHPDAQPRSQRWQTRPAGIVFHASEGELASFVQEHTGWIRRQSQDLLTYAQRRHLYHYVVDRFGGVHRIVEESDVADHAGHSVWADADGVYLNLNASFLGVVFEARTSGAASADLVRPAQLHAGRVLTELLRSKYRLAPGNCVTHAQVSVNPFNAYLGFHADWARGFPFASLGLPDNHLQPLPSVSLFGFSYEPAFFEAAGPSLRAALRRGLEENQRQAAARRLTAARWRAALRQRYRNAAAEAATERVALEALARLEEYQP
jgi:hypothetical protein